MEQQSTKRRSRRNTAQAEVEAKRLCGLALVREVPGLTSVAGEPEGRAGRTAGAAAAGDSGRGLRTYSAQLTRARARAVKGQSCA